jgi:hypothetical protein
MNTDGSGQQELFESVVERCGDTLAEDTEPAWSA